MFVFCKFPDGKNRTEEAQIHPEYTFDVFLCVTILIEQRENIFLCQDMADLVQLVCRYVTGTSTVYTSYLLNLQICFCSFNF